MKKITLKNATQKGKRYTVIMEGFPNMKNHSHSFGSASGKTFIDGRNQKEKSAFIKRHENDKGWNQIHSGIYYSRYLLWGPYDNLKQNIKSLERRLNAKIINKI